MSYFYGTRWTKGRPRKIPSPARLKSEWEEAKKLNPDLKKRDFAASKSITARHLNRLLKTTEQQVESLRKEEPEQSGQGLLVSDAWAFWPSY